MNDSDAASKIKPDGARKEKGVTWEMLDASHVFCEALNRYPDLTQRRSVIVAFTGFVDEIAALSAIGWGGGEPTRADLERMIEHLERSAAPRKAWWWQHRRPWAEMPDPGGALARQAPPKARPPCARAPEPAEPEPAEPEQVTFGLAPDGGSLAKRVQDGQVIGAGHRLRYRWAAEPVALPAGLLRVLEQAAELGAFAVRARPLAAVGRRAFKDDPDKGPAGLEAVPRRWCALDWEGFDLPGVAALDGPAVARALRPFMPPELAAADLIWQLTAGAGVKEGVRARTWHLLDRPLGTAELKAWLAPLFASEEPMIDPSTLENVQPIFLGVIGGPEIQRFGILEGRRRIVAVPPIILPGAEPRARRTGSRPAAGPAAPRVRPDRGCRARSRRAAPRMRRLVSECLTQIRTTPHQEGLRLPAFKHWGARALRLAEIAGLPRAHVEDLLLRAGAHLYEGDQERIERNVLPLLEWWRRNG